MESVRQVKLWSGQHSQREKAAMSALDQVCSWEARGLSWISGLGSRLCYQPARELGQIVWTKQSQSTEICTFSVECM